MSKMLIIMQYLTLETEHILAEIDSNLHHVFVTLSGDNLTSHKLGRFNLSFSFCDIC